MTKKQLKIRVRALEHAVGSLIEQNSANVQRIADLEEIVFDLDSVELSVPAQPDRGLN